MDSSSRAFSTRKWVSEMASLGSAARRLHYWASDQIEEGHIPSGTQWRVGHKLTMTNNCGNTTFEDATIQNFDGIDKTLLQSKWRIQATDQMCCKIVKYSRPLVKVWQ